LLALAILCALLPAHAGRTDLPLNDQWHFERIDGPPLPLDAAAPEAARTFDDSRWETVFLPHTPRLESPTAAQNYFQGICWYRRHISPVPAWREKKVSVEFEGAMQTADVWLNGRHVTTHYGGYLPFSVDLTAALAGPGGAEVAVRLDNTDQKDVPPGREHDQLDFAYFGGLYRNAHLIVTDPLHLTDAVAANRPAAGGIFVRTESISSQSAAIRAQADIVNEGAGEENINLHFSVINPDGASVAAADVPIGPLAAGGVVTTNCLLTIPHPKLWHPDHPWLYVLKTEVQRGTTAADSVSTRFGIRTVACDDQLGFILNGEPYVIRGANRHQDFPWLGNAVADNAAYRDLRRLRNAGFNFLRLAHYPQSPAVMEAADELGLMVTVCTPGWQHFTDDEIFAQRARQNVREMVCWHRNHPSAVFWEVSLNETYGHDAFYAECARLAHEEYPGSQMLTAGDSYASHSLRHYEVPYTDWGGFYNRGAAHGFEGARRSFTREYGDYEFGGEHSTTRTPRGAGEEALLLQTWNFIWSHNRNANAPWMIGDCLWVGVDHFRGCSQELPISRCGVLDYLRLPKFSYYFFQSQRETGAPQIFLANYWTPRPAHGKVVVLSNCQEVELFVNGQSLGRQKPDHGPDSDYGVWHPAADPLYMLAHKSVLDDEKATAAALSQPHDDDRRAMFDGGNCQYLSHPPFTFVPVTYAAGELKAVGYVNGQPVATDLRHTPGQPAQLKLAADQQDRPFTADGADAIFIRATVCDANGNPVVNATNLVDFTITGPARIVCPAQISAEAGIATALIQSTSLKAGRVSLRVTAPNLQPARLDIKTAAAF
jgi:beta-galactosidase